MLKWLYIVLLTGISCLNNAAIAEEEIIVSPNTGINEKGYAELLVVSDAEKLKVCKTYEGKHIGYYGKVYLVKNCKRHLLETRDAVWQLSKNNRLVIQVKSDVIASIAQGDGIDQEGGLATFRNCKSLNGAYISADLNTIYFMKNCQLQSFPDWETFTAHRRKMGKEKSEIVGVSDKALIRYGNVTEMATIIDGEIKKLLDDTAEVELIPLSEACKGVNNKYVSFYSKIYKIENCRKRRVNAAKATTTFKGKLSPQELTAEQWISLPDGKPLKL